MAPSMSIKLYRSRVSGHAHRAELFLALLGLPYDAIDVDLRAGEQKTPTFLALNPFGQVPVLDDAGTVVADSNAILVYLAHRYAPEHWLARDALGVARIQRWLTVAAGDIAFGPAMARLQRFGMAVDVPAATARATRLFGLMESELRQQDFLAAPHPTIADIACYSYIARAPEGGITLEPYPALRAWLVRVEALPGFLPMMELPPAAAA